MVLFTNKHVQVLSEHNLVIQVPSVFSGESQAVPGDDSSHPQEKPLLEDANFLLCEEYRDSLIKQVAYVQLKSSNKIFLYVFPMNLARTYT